MFEKLSFTKILDPDVLGGNIQIQPVKASNGGITLYVTTNINATKAEKNLHKNPHLVLKGKTGADLLKDLQQEAPELLTFFEE